MLKTLRILVAILILFGGVNLMQLINTNNFIVDAFSDQRIVSSVPIIVRPSQPIYIPGIRPSQPIYIPGVRLSQPIN